MPAFDCRNLFCAGRQPRYRLKRQCLPASLAKLPRADPSCPPRLPRGRFAGYSWPREVGKPWLDVSSGALPKSEFRCISDFPPRRDGACGPSLPCASSSCSKHSVKATRAGAGLWLGAQPSSHQGQVWAWGGATEPGLLIQRAPTRERWSSRGKSQLPPANKTFVKDCQTALEYDFWKMYKMKAKLQHRRR